METTPMAYSSDASSSGTLMSYDPSCRQSSLYTQFPKQCGNCIGNNCPEECLQVNSDAFFLAQTPFCAPPPTRKQCAESKQCSVRGCISVLTADGEKCEPREEVACQYHLLDTSDGIEMGKALRELKGMCNNDKECSAANCAKKQLDITNAGRCCELIQKATATFNPSDYGNKLQYVESVEGAPLNM